MENEPSAATISRYRCDALVIGGGPAGIAAACCAAESGLRVVLIDNNPALGGQIWRGHAAPGDSTPLAVQWIERAYHAGISTIAGADVFYGQPKQEAQGMAVVQAETRSGTCEVRCWRLILATGARERFIPFPGWTLPGVYGAGGLQALVKVGLPVAGKRVVIAGSGPLLLAVAAYLRAAGADVCAVAEQAALSRLAGFGLGLLGQPGKGLQALGLQRRLLGVPYLAGCWPIAAHGDGRLSEVVLRQGKRTWSVPCDYLACGFHLAPNLELPRLLGCALQSGFVRVGDYQETSQPGIFCAGETTGIGGVDLALLEGQVAGYAAAGNRGMAQRLLAQRNRQRQYARRLNQAFALREELKLLPTPDTIVCRCEDVTRAGLEPFAGDSWRAAKLHTRCGMGPCQGRVCGTALEFLYNWQVDSIRPPIIPVRIDSLITMADFAAARRGGEAGTVHTTQ